nr:hypothetical protein [Gluconacetobacter entanii]
MGARGDIIKTMHRAMTERSRDRVIVPRRLRDLGT